jgi:ribose 5-phosphate isomerase B
MRIAVGADHGGYLLKEKLVHFLKKRGHRVKDFGTFSQESCDYPKFSEQVARAVARKKAARGILVCKSGTGSCIAANKVRGIRAVVCLNKKQAVLSRQHNDTNVIVFGALFISAKKAQEILKIWLKTEFEGGRHARRLRQIGRIEKNCC